MIAVAEEFYTCEHQSYTVFAASEDSANACRLEGYTDDGAERCYVYTVRFCQECSEMIWKDLSAVPGNYNRYKGEMELNKITKLGYFKDGRTECVHLI